MKRLVDRMFNIYTTCIRSVITPLQQKQMTETKKRISATTKKNETKTHCVGVVGCLCLKWTTITGKNIKKRNLRMVGSPKMAVRKINRIKKIKNQNKTVEEGKNKDSDINTHQN